MSIPKSTAPSEPIKIQLARDEEAWSELRQLLDDRVKQLLALGNEQSVKAFMFIVDLLSNENIDPDEQAVAAEHIQQTAFTYSRRSIREKERFLNELNPGRVVRRRKVVAHA